MFVNRDDYALIRATSKTESLYAAASRFTVRRFVVQS